VILGKIFWAKEHCPLALFSAISSGDKWRKRGFVVSVLDGSPDGLEAAEAPGAWSCLGRKVDFDGGTMCADHRS